MAFYIFDFDYFRQFIEYFTFTSYKKTNDVSIYAAISRDFLLKIILDGSLKNCIKLY